MAEPLHPLDPRRRAKKSQPARAGKGKPARGRGTGKGGARPARPRRKRAASAGQGPPPGMIRIQKVLAEAGLASRRTVEDLVLEGRISVNGETVTLLPVFVDPERDEIRMDGEPVRRRPMKKAYVLLNKPKGVVCTNADPKGRPRAVDLVAQYAQRLFPVGRLDAESTGLILMTNDGELANRIAHPRYGLDKTYLVEVEGRLEGEEIEKLKRGMYLDGARTTGAGVKVLSRSNQQTIVEVRLNEGRNREIRRLMARLGHKVRNLRRVAIGPVTDRGVKTGKTRPLSEDEVRALFRATEIPE